MSQSADGLVHQLHGQVLRTVSQLTREHHQGLAQMSRYLRAKKLINKNTAKKLYNLDAAFNICRHITTVSSESFFASPVSEISDGLRNAAETKQPLQSQMVSNDEFVVENAITTVLSTSQPPMQSHMVSNIDEIVL